MPDPESGAVAVEIERKFLLRNEDWRGEASRSAQIADGLLAASEGGKVRIRIQDSQATVTIKGPRCGLARDEFEYPIPLDDAHLLFARHCAGPILLKTRYFVPYQGFVWEVDVYRDLLAGVVLAEIELDRADVHVPLPSWLGDEVTGLPRYRKASLVAEHLARSRIASIPG